MTALRRAIEGIEPSDHLASIVREQILAVTEGKKETPFEDTYRSYKATKFFSQMDENQRHAMMIASVVLAAIGKYNFKKRMSK